MRWQPPRIRARSVQTADFRFTLPALGVSNAKRVTQLASTVSAPMPVDQAYHYFLKKAEDVYRAGNYPEAAGMYSELIEKYPKARTPYLRRGDCYASLEEFDRAIADFDAAIKLLPLEPRLPRQELGPSQQRSDKPGAGRRRGGPSPGAGSSPRLT